MTLPPFPFLPASPEERLRLTQYGELCARMAVEAALPAGWAAVPKEPTAEIMCAMFGEIGREPDFRDLKDAYRAAIDAALRNGK